MAPEALRETLRKALAMGADEAVLLADPGLEGSDVWATAYAIAARAAKLGFDLLIVGGLTDDSSTGAVPGALAEHLGLPCVTNARKVEIKETVCEVERETDVGYQTVRTPAAGTVDDGADVRRAALRVAQRHHGRQEKDDRDDAAGRSWRWICRSAPSGSKTELRDVCAAAAARQRRRTVEAADGAAGAQAILDFLSEKKLV